LENTKQIDSHDAITVSPLTLLETDVPAVIVPTKL